MAFISLGKVDKNLIPIVIGNIICFLNRILDQYAPTKLFENVVLTSICTSLSNIICILPYIIIRIKYKKVIYKESESSNGRIKYIYNNMKSLKTIKGKYKFIFLASIIFIIEEIMFVSTISIETNSWICLILFTCLFYYLIFKIKLYIHHYLSIILIISTGIILDLVFKYLQTEIIDNWFLILLRLIREILCF